MQIRIALLNNLATAREKAYDLTGEVIHLKQARELLARFKDNISGLEMDPSEEAEQVARIDERLAAIDQTLDGGEDPGEPDQPEEPEQPEGPTEQPGPGTDGPEENDQPGRPLVIAGATMLGLGVVAGGVSFALMGVGAGLNDLEDREYTVQEREDLENQGDSINGAAWATGITGIALVGAGAVLTAIGVSKNNKAKSNVAVAPYGSPTGAGLSLRARF